MTEVTPASGSARTRTVIWQDPMALAAAGRGMAGVDFLRAIADGTLAPPPISMLTNMHVVSVEVDDVVFGAHADESFYNPIGVVHGGLACTLLDTVAGCAVHSTLPAGVGYSSLEIKVSYLRPIHADAQLVAHGWVTKPGRRVAFADADVRDQGGVLLATASSTCLVIGA